MTRTYFCGRAGTGTRGIVISCVGNAYSDVGQGFSAPEINLLPERLIGSPDRALTNSVFDFGDRVSRPQKLGSSVLHPALSTLNIREMVPSASVTPIHPGALNYYREIGLIQ